MKNTMKKIIRLLKSSRYQLVLLCIIGFSFTAKSQYIFNTSATSTATSINAGSQFTYVFNYSTAGNTTTGLNVVAETTLPENMLPSNESNFSSNVIFPTSQITSITYNSVTKKVITTFINPLPAGVTGQFEIRLKYLNGVTPNGYSPLRKRDIMISTRHILKYSCHKVTFCIKGIVTNKLPTRSLGYTNHGLVDLISICLIILICNQ